MEAITSRPLLLSSVGRLTEHGRQKTMTITSTHAQADFIQEIFQRVQRFFNDAVDGSDRWHRILSEAMKKYRQRNSLN